MSQDAQIAGHDLILQIGSRWNVNSVPVISDYNDGSP